MVQVGKHVNVQIMVAGGAAALLAIMVVQVVNVTHLLSQPTRLQLVQVLVILEVRAAHMVCLRLMVLAVRISFVAERLFQQQLHHQLFLPIHHYRQHQLQLLLVIVIILVPQEVQAVGWEVVGQMPVPVCVVL